MRSNLLSISEIKEIIERELINCACNDVEEIKELQVIVTSDYNYRLNDIVSLVFENNDKNIKIKYIILNDMDEINNLVECPPRNVMAIFLSAFEDEN